MMGRLDVGEMSEKCASCLLVKMLISRSPSPPCFPVMSLRLMCAETTMSSSFTGVVLIGCIAMHGSWALEVDVSVNSSTSGLDSLVNGDAMFPFKTRRQTSSVYNINPDEDDFPALVANAVAGTTFVLADGTYQLSGTIVIAKDITIRAQNEGEATLDGQDTHRVFEITSGTVVLEGLVITRGKVSGVSA
jgi:hypothetical protein